MSLPWDCSSKINSTCLLACYFALYHEFYFISHFFPFLLDSPSNERSKKNNILAIRSFLFFFYPPFLSPQNIRCCYTEPSSRRLLYPFCISNGTFRMFFHFWMINIFHYRQKFFSLSLNFFAFFIFWRKSKFFFWKSGKILYGLIVDRMRERGIYIITIANISIWKTAFYHQYSRACTSEWTNTFSADVWKQKSTKLNEHSHLYFGVVDGLNSRLP